jgi:hypothetical protein
MHYAQMHKKEGQASNNCMKTAGLCNSNKTNKSERLTETRETGYEDKAVRNKS